MSAAQNVKLFLYCCKCTVNIKHWKHQQAESNLYTTTTNTSSWEYSSYSLLFPLMKSMLYESYWMLTWICGAKETDGGLIPVSGQHTQTVISCVPLTGGDEVAFRPTDRCPRWMGQCSVCLRHLCLVNHMTLSCWGVSWSLCHHSPSHCHTFLKGFTNTIDSMNISSAPLPFLPFSTCIYIWCHVRSIEH